MLDSDIPILHLSHPIPTSWMTIIDALSSSLVIPTVPFARWMELLEQSAEDSAGGELDNPALRIINFFRVGHQDLMRGSTRQAMGLPVLGLDSAKSVSPTLRGDMPALDATDVDLWLASWKENGLFA